MKPVESNDHFSAEQRVLVEQVSHSPSASPLVRRRAAALLLVDEGAPLTTISRVAALNRNSVLSLMQRHRAGGVRAALLGRRPSQSRRHWLALSPMRTFPSSN